ncbi:hypothetical protein GCM10011594_25520 [Nakamurella endophytica]|uniref:Uncharacterized protein n=1 Tax=Nakamurella endophytica TaxID=1748367 RepID=A0A917T0T7_9ACTN|nr:hypothetical protein GCM10011594_25520 [Nakamurella endophytica]
MVGAGGAATVVRDGFTALPGAGRVGRGAVAVVRAAVPGAAGVARGPVVAAAGVRDGPVGAAALPVRAGADDGRAAVVAAVAAVGAGAGRPGAESKAPGAPPTVPAPVTTDGAGPEVRVGRPGVAVAAADPAEGRVAGVEPAGDAEDGVVGVADIDGVADVGDGTGVEDVVPVAEAVVAAVPPALPPEAPATAGLVGAGLEAARTPVSAGTPVLLLVVDDAADGADPPPALCRRTTNTRPTRASTARTITETRLAQYTRDEWGPTGCNTVQR